jgi:hypothetical protein
VRSLFVALSATNSERREGLEGGTARTSGAENRGAGTLGGVGPTLRTAQRGLLFEVDHYVLYLGVVLQRVHR